MRRSAPRRIEHDLFDAGAVVRDRSATLVDLIVAVVIDRAVTELGRARVDQRIAVVAVGPRTHDDRPSGARRHERRREAVLVGVERGIVATVGVLVADVGGAEIGVTTVARSTAHAPAGRVTELADDAVATIAVGVVRLEVATARVTRTLGAAAIARARDPVAAHPVARIEHAPAGERVARIDGAAKAIIADHRRAAHASRLGGRAGIAPLGPIARVQIVALFVCRASDRDAPDRGAAPHRVGAHRIVGGVRAPTVHARVDGARDRVRAVRRAHRRGVRRGIGARAVDARVDRGVAHRAVRIIETRRIGIDERAAADAREPRESGEHQPWPGGAEVHPTHFAPNRTVVSREGRAVNTFTVIILTCAHAESCTLRLNDRARRIPNDRGLAMVSEDGPGGGCDRRVDADREDRRGGDGDGVAGGAGRDGGRAQGARFTARPRGGERATVRARGRGRGAHRACRDRAGDRSRG